MGGPGSGRKRSVGESLQKIGYRRLHTAYARGYVRRGEQGIAHKYKGRYGKGYTVHNRAVTPSGKVSSRYFAKTYYVKGK